MESDFHLLAQLFWLPRRLSLCFPASLKTHQTGASGSLRSLAQSANRQDLAGLALKKTLLRHIASSGGMGLLIDHQKVGFPRSTAIKEATGFLATASVARLALSFCLFPAKTTAEAQPSRSETRSFPSDRVSDQFECAAFLGGRCRNENRLGDLMVGSLNGSLRSDE